MQQTIRQDGSTCRLSCKRPFWDVALFARLVLRSGINYLVEYILFLEALHSNLILAD
jgi:hypothetical protein